MRKQSLGFSVLALLAALVLAVVSVRPASAGNSVGTKFVGTVQSIDAPTFSFVLLEADGTSLTVVVAADFDFSVLAVGAKVEVTGTLNTDGSLAATKVKVFLPDEDLDEVTGTIQSLDPATLSFVVLTADGQSISVIVAEGFDFTKLAVGQTVEVKGTLNEDGTLTALRVEVEQPDDEPDQPGPSDGFYCQNPDVQHPMGARLAERFGVDYATLLGWYCQGYGWGQIMLALKTSQVTGEDPLTLLQERNAGAGWGHMWHDRGLNGHSAHDGQPNGSHDQGGQDNGRGNNDHGGNDHGGSSNNGNGNGHSGHGGGHGGGHH
jgi:hypothetical protein